MGRRNLVLVAVILGVSAFLQTRGEEGELMAAFHPRMWTGGITVSRRKAMKMGGKLRRRSTATGTCWIS